MRIVANVRKFPYRDNVSEVSKPIPLELPGEGLTEKEKEKAPACSPWQYFDPTPKPGKCVNKSGHWGSIVNETGSGTQEPGDPVPERERCITNAKGQKFCYEELKPDEVCLKPINAEVPPLCPPPKPESIANETTGITGSTIDNLTTTETIDQGQGSPQTSEGTTTTPPTSDTDAETMIPHRCDSDPNDPKKVECICKGAKDCLDLERSGRCDGQVQAGEVYGSCVEKRK